MGELQDLIEMDKNSEKVGERYKVEGAVLTEDDWNDWILNMVFYIKKRIKEYK